MLSRCQNLSTCHKCFLRSFPLCFLRWCWHPRTRNLHGRCLFFKEHVLRATVWAWAGCCCDGQQAVYILIMQVKIIHWERLWHLKCIKINVTASTVLLPVHLACQCLVHFCSSSTNIIVSIQTIVTSPVCKRLDCCLRLERHCKRTTIQRQFGLVCRRKLFMFFTIVQYDCKVNYGL